MFTSISRGQFVRVLAAVVAACSLSLATAGVAAAATINGTNGNDYLQGTGDNDLIIGFAGNDTLVGSWGDDTLSGGNGDDTLYGSPGNDLLNGGYGNDVIVAGADFVRDVVYCGPGWDVAYIRPGDVTNSCEVIRWS
jgi:Ca2+-binding RTX toxin-like protein